MKTVRIEFHGGFKDGDVVAGDPSGGAARIFLFLTDWGCIGQRFRVEPDSEDTGSEDPWDEILAIKDKDAMLRAILEYSKKQEELQKTHPLETSQVYKVTECDKSSEEIRIRVEAIEDREGEWPSTGDGK